MRLADVLTQEQVGHLELSEHVSITVDATVRDALEQMRTSGRNVCLVTEGGRLSGILTERDVLRRILELPSLMDQSVTVLMTPNPIAVSPETSAAEALRTMEENHFRNLPVVDAQGKILGAMTHKAIIDYLAARYPEAVLNRPPDPERFPRKPEGG